jgi:hypothetical protein
MRSIDLRSPGRRVLLLGSILLIAAITSSLAYWMEERHLSIFGPQSSFAVPITSREGKEYVMLGDVLEKLGPLEVSSSTDKFKLRFNSLDAE